MQNPLVEPFTGILKGSAVQKLQDTNPKPKTLNLNPYPSLTLNPKP